MRVGTDVFAGLVTVNGFHVLVGLKARGTSDPRKHLCKSRHSSGGRHLGLARLASARWSISRCLCRLHMLGVYTCTSLVAQLHLEYTWRLHNRQRHLPDIVLKPSSRRWGACHRRRRIHSHSFPAFPIPLFPGSPFVPVDCFVIGVLARVSASASS
jgi:hypothetical protein